MNDELTSHAPRSDRPVGLVSEPRNHFSVWVVYFILFAMAIPWYWPTNYRGHLIFGVPLWAATTIFCVILLASWTAWVIVRYWRDEGE